MLSTCHGALSCWPTSFTWKSPLRTWSGLPLRAHCLEPSSRLIMDHSPILLQSDGAASVYIIFIRVAFMAFLLKLASDAVTVFGGWRD